MKIPEYKIDANGTKCWYLNGKGKLHREDINPETGLTMPAIEHANGDKFWYLNGKLHREDGPAVEGANGDKYWYLNGNLHREDRSETGVSLPAIELDNGNKWWCQDGKFHREDGPAIEYADGRTEYWINDKHIHQLDNKRIYGKENLQKFLLLI